jgi:hypothetical protein
VDERSLVSEKGREKRWEAYQKRFEFRIRETILVDKRRRKEKEENINGKH